MKKYLLLLSLLSFLPAGVFNSLAQNSNTQKQQIKQEAMKELQKIPNDPKTKKMEENNKALRERKITPHQHLFNAIDIMLDFDYEDLMVADILQLKEYIKELRKQKSQNYPNFKKNWDKMYYAIHQRRDKNAKESMQIYKLTEAVKKLANIKYSNSTPDNLQQAFNELRKSENPQEFMRGSHNLSSSNRQEIITSFKEFKNSYANVASEKSSFKEQVSRLNKLKDENKGLGDVLNGLVKTCEDCAKSIQSGR